MLAQAAIEADAASGGPGPLVLVMGSDIYLYASTDRALLGHLRFRADRTNGFYELTAISHIGPALAGRCTTSTGTRPRWTSRA
jgi:hypothetical protein